MADLGRSAAVYGFNHGRRGPHGIILAFPAPQFSGGLGLQGDVPCSVTLLRFSPRGSGPAVQQLDMLEAAFARGGAIEHLAIVDEAAKRTDEEAVLAAL